MEMYENADILFSESGNSLMRGWMSRILILFVSGNSKSSFRQRLCYIALYHMGRQELKQNDLKSTNMRYSHHQENTYFNVAPFCKLRIKKRIDKPDGTVLIEF